MMLRKIDKMHQMFGEDKDHKCKDCCHFIRERYRGKTYSKCKIYGQSNSEATDMAGRNTACGLYNRPYEGDVDIYTIRDTQRQNEPLEGQMSLFE